MNKINILIGVILILISIGFLHMGFKLDTEKSILSFSIISIIFLWCGVSTFKEKKRII